MKWQQNEVHPLQPSPRGMIRLRSEVSPILRRMGCKCLEVLFPYCLVNFLGVINYQSWNPILFSVPRSLSGMPYPQLYVVFYRPRFGNYQHWALYLRHGDDHTIYELIDSSPNFRKNKLKVDPQTSRRYLGKLLVASPGESEIPLVSRAIKDAEVDNTTVELD